MTKKEIREHSGLIACALRCMGRSPLSEEGTSKDVDKCVKEYFRGDWKKFEKWAMDFLSSGFGVQG